MVKLENFVVVPPDVEDAGARRLPPRGTGGLGLGTTGEFGDRHDVSSVVRTSASAYRVAAGSVRTRPPVCVTSRNEVSTSRASETSRAVPSSPRNVLAHRGKRVSSSV